MSLARKQGASGSSRHVISRTSKASFVKEETSMEVVGLRMIVADLQANGKCVDSAFVDSPRLSCFLR